MRRPADLLRSSSWGPLGDAAAPADAATDDDLATSPGPGPADLDAATGALALLTRAATLLVGDQDVARRLVDDVVASVPEDRRVAALTAVHSPDVWRPLVAQAHAVDARLASAAVAAVVADPLATRPPGTVRRPNRREVRWALLGVPMVERAAVVLDAAGLRHDVVAAAIGLDAAGLDGARADGRGRLAAALAVEPAVVTPAVRAALDAVHVVIDVAAVRSLAARPRTALPTERRRQALVIAGVALALVGAVVWLSQREPARRSTLPIGPVPRIEITRATTTTAARRSATPVVLAASPVTPAATTAAAPVTAERTPATTDAPTTSTATTAPPTATAPAAVTAAPATAPPATAAPTTAAAPVTAPAPTTTRPAPTTTRPAPTTTRPAPTTTLAAPTTTAAPAPAVTRLAISSASCSRLLLSASFTISGVTDRSTPQVAVDTPYGRYTANAVPTGTGSSASWTVSAWVPLALSSDATVTAGSGAQSASTTMTC